MTEDCADATVLESTYTIAQQSQWTKTKSKEQNLNGRDFVKIKNIFMVNDKFYVYVPWKGPTGIA